MKNSILNLGKVLNAAEQKSVNGGIISDCSATPVYRDGYCYICNVQYSAHSC